MFRVWGASPLVQSAAGAVLTQQRGLKPKKKNKLGQQFVKESQPWRDEWRSQREVQLAENLRKFMIDSSTERREPWDSRFAPFDREERDGVSAELASVDHPSFNSQCSPFKFSRIEINDSASNLVAPRAVCKTNAKHARAMNPHRICTYMKGHTERHPVVERRAFSRFTNAYTI